MIEPISTDGQLYHPTSMTWLGPDTEEQRHEIMRRWTKEIARGIRQLPDREGLSALKKSELANIALEQGHQGIGEQTKGELVDLILGESAPEVE